MDLQITIPNFEHTEALDNQIRKHAEKLQKYFTEIHLCHVVVKYASKQHHKGNLFDIRLNITVPGKEIAINREANQDFSIALRDAFNAAKRQLEDYARLQRGEIKTHEPLQFGIIDELFAEDGYGYIQSRDTTERFYFDSNNAAHPSFEHFKVGDEVKFTPDFGAEGPRAKRVSLGKHHVY